MKRMYKKATALIMCITFILSSIVCTAGAQSIGETLRESSLQIAENTTYTNIIANHETYGRQEANVFTVDPALPGIVPVAMYGSKLYGRSTITTAVDYATMTEGLSIAGGVNGDFYSFTTGISLGMVVHNGILNSSDAGYPAIGFTENGEAVIGNPNIAISMVSDEGISIPVDHFNKYRTVYGVYLFSEDFSAESRTSTLGTHIVLDIIDGEPSIGESMTVIVSDIMTDASNIKMVEGTLLLSVDNDGPLDKISQIARGQMYTITFTAQDEIWNDVTEAIGGGQIILSDGEILPDSTSEVAPRTAAGITEDGKLVLAQLDGRQSGHSKGAKITEMAEFMASLGCVDAINLDGGGSSTTYLRSPGYASGEIVNAVSDGAPRKNANYILLANTLEPDGHQFRLQFYPYDIEALPNTTIALDVKASDVSYHAAAAPEPETLIFSVTEGMGEVTADVKSVILTTGEMTGTGVVSAAVGAASGETKLTILDSVDEINVYRGESSNKAVTIDLDRNEEVMFRAESYKNGAEVYSSNKSYTWTVSTPDIGTVTENGVFQAADKVNVSGTLTVSYGDVSKSVNITVGKGLDDIAPSVAVDPMEGWDSSNEFLNIGAIVTDNSAMVSENITLEIDGQPTEFTYDPETGILLSHLTNVYSPGLHKASVTAVDAADNRTTHYRTFFVSSDPRADIFVDVNGHWARDYIEFLYNMELIRGIVDDTTGDVYYKPGANITRAEFAVMLARYLDLDITAEPDENVVFTDEADIPVWAKQEIYAVASAGAMTGKPDEMGGIKFDPNANLTRAEIITAIGRLIPDGYASSDVTFADKADIGTWALPYVGKLISLGVVSGYSDGTLLPQNNVTRGEVAKILFAVY